MGHQTEGQSPYVMTIMTVSDGLKFVKSPYPTKVVGTQLYPVFPVHRPEETSMIPSPIVNNAW